MVPIAVPSHDNAAVHALQSRDNALDVQRCWFTDTVAWVCWRWSLCVQEETEEAPGDIVFSCPAMDVAFHPLANVVAVALVTGTIEVYDILCFVDSCVTALPGEPIGCYAPCCPCLSTCWTVLAPSLDRFTYNSDLCTKALSIAAHTDSCRALEFAPTADCAYTPLASSMTWHDGPCLHLSAPSSDLRVSLFVLGVARFVQWLFRPIYSWIQCRWGGGMGGQGGTPVSRRRCCCIRLCQLHSRHRVLP
jgi:hypothetical protein